MTNEQKTRIFITLYLASLRAVCKNQFLKPPPIGSKKYEQLDKARQIADDLGGDYADYIHVQFQAFRYLKNIKFPKPEHLVSEGAINRYKVYQMKKNKYRKENYTIDGDKFIVTATGKNYPFYVVESNSSNDMNAIFAILISKMESYNKMGKDYKKKALEAIEYLIAKLEFKGKRPTESLLRAREELK